MSLRKLFLGRKSRAARRGVLTLEWILLITVVVIGIIAGLGAVRDAILAELKDLADAILALNVGS
ncbi:MAG TPA: hypothetical protein VFE24_07355 [Pirellulales bacterium]|jgi:hypothetical protein|nr:hypothetical protein [Pirellulales bacterium]